MCIRDSLRDALGLGAELDDQRHGADLAHRADHLAGVGRADAEERKKELMAQNLSLIHILGFLTDDVRALLKECAYPGMKVLEFAFDSRDGGDYRPHSYPTNCIEMCIRDRLSTGSLTSRCETSCAKI